MIGQIINRMLSRYNRYIKYNPLKAKLYERHSPDSIEYIFTACFCVVFMDSERYTIFSVYSQADPLHFRTLDIEMVKTNISLKDGELNALEFRYQGRVFGIATKPYLFPQLKDMLESEQESTILTDLSTVQQRIEKSMAVQKISNPFASSFVISESYITYETKFTTSNHLDIALQKNGNRIQLFMHRQNKIKLIHSFDILFLGEVSRIKVMAGTEFLCISFKNEPILWFYNIDTGDVSEFNLNTQFQICELGIIDFILPKEIIKQDILLMTQRSIYLLNLPKYLRKERSVTEIVLPSKLPHERYIYLMDHSLSCYSVIIQNTQQKRDYQLKIIKNFGTNNVILTASIHKKIIDSDFSSKLLLSCFDDGSIQLVQITSLDSEGKFKEPIKLKLKEEDRIKYKIKREEKFSKVKISYNRTYVIGVIVNLLVIWRTQSVLGGDTNYEVSVFAKKILEVENWRSNGENLWLALEDKNCVLSLFS